MPGFLPLVSFGSFWNCDDEPAIVPFDLARRRSRLNPSLRSVDGRQPQAGRGFVPHDPGSSRPIPAGPPHAIRSCALHQRVPVKIRIDPANPLQGLLRPGMSATPTIDVSPGAAADLPPSGASFHQADRLPAPAATTVVASVRP